MTLKGHMRLEAQMTELLPRSKWRISTQSWSKGTSPPSLHLHTQTTVWSGLREHRLLHKLVSNQNLLCSPLPLVNSSSNSTLSPIVPSQIFLNRLDVQWCAVPWILPNPDPDPDPDPDLPEQVRCTVMCCATDFTFTEFVSFTIYMSLGWLD